MTRFAFIDREKAFYDLTVLCRLLKVSRSGFYAWLRRPPSPRAVAGQVLTEQIRAAYDDNRQVYGSPRIHAELADAGVRVGKKRVARLMRKAEIVGCHRRKRSFSITKQNPKAEAAPDLVDRKFIATRPNQLWVADVTSGHGAASCTSRSRSICTPERSWAGQRPPPRTSPSSSSA